MISIRRYAVPLVVCAFLLIPFFSHAANDPSELRITTDGAFSAKNLYVIQKSGSVIYARAKWGQTFVRVTLFTAPDTLLTKNHGGTLAIADIKEGDLLTAEGALAVGAEELVVNVKKLKDMSLQAELKTLSGSVQTVNRDAQTLTLRTAPLGIITVRLASSATLTKGVRVIEFSEVAVGDKVVLASGMYDYPTNTLSVTAMEFYQDKAVFAARDFKGILKGISGATLPTTLSVLVGNTTYTVYLSEKTRILTKAKQNGTLARFVVGDSITFHGKIRQANITEADADSIADLNF